MPIRLDPWTHIKEAGWSPVTHIAFTIDLGIGVPASDFIPECGGAVPATGAFISGWSTGFAFPFSRTTAIRGYRDGSWDGQSLGDVVITGLPFSESISFDPGLVAPQQLQVDHSRFRPAASGGTGIQIPDDAAHEFNPDISAVADLVAVMGDGSIYCADTDPIDGLGFLGMNSISSGAHQPVPTTTSSILSHLTVTRNGKTYIAAGTYTVERSLPGDPFAGDLPKVLWCLFRKPDA